MALIRNRLKSILQEKGIERFSPTNELLEKLGSMSRHRFFKILDNRLTTNLMSSDEQFYIEKWLHEELGVPKEEIRLIEEVPDKQAPSKAAIIKKHKLS